jgi:hypothetical protein
MARDSCYRRVTLPSSSPYSPPSGPVGPLRLMGFGEGGGDGMPGRSGPEVGCRKRSRCTHHWVIETASGATSKGRCKRCGSVRSFRNVQEPSKSPYQRSKSN